MWRAKGLEQSLREGEQKGLHFALNKMVASGIPEERARSVLGL